VSTESSIEFVVADTNVLSYLTKASRHSAQYLALIGTKTIVVPFVARVELDGFEWKKPRRDRLDSLLAACILVEQSSATGTWFNLAAVKRRELNLISAVGDNDLWIIATAGEHSAPLLTHDRAQATVARSLGITVLTALED
jgi:predicted nucleic acid-binding protein